jgi:hypothetical protein
MSFTQIQHDLLAGSLLGDGSLQTETGRTWRYRALQKSDDRALQKSDDRAYLMEKYRILEPFCKTPPRESETFDERTNKSYFRYSFNTLQLPELKYYGDMFYSYDPTTKLYRKDVPLNVEKILTPRALAFFYMDDGALKWLYHSNAMRICTENFSVVGVNRLQKALNKNFDLNTSLTKKVLTSGEIRYRIAIKEGDSSAFREVIKPFLIDCMRYKVSDGNRGHL